MKYMYKGTVVESDKPLNPAVFKPIEEKKATVPKAAASKKTTTEKE